MFLSRIALDISNRNTLEALSSPRKFHGALESNFLGEKPRNLWRIDNLNGQLYFLALTETAPDFSSFCKQFCKTRKASETKSYDNFLENITNGSRWHFRLTANPTWRTVSKIRNKHGKLYSCNTIAEQKNWLIKKSEQCGFQLNLSMFDIVQNKWYRFHKADIAYISLLSVTYEGVLEVTDVELFRYALTHGIGKAKAYGMGLMTIMQ